MPLTYQPRTNAPYYQNGQDGGGPTINIGQNLGAHVPSLVLEDRVGPNSSAVSFGSRVNGNAWLIVGTPNALDDWATQEGSIAMWYSGWLFRRPKVGELLWVIADKQAYFVDSFSGAAPVLRPVNAPHTSGTEVDTGRTDGGGTPKKVLRKRIAFGAGPSAGTPKTRSVAHGITSLPVAKGAHLFIRATISDGTTPRQLPYYDGTNYVIVKVDATNVTVVSNADMSGSDVVVELEYAR